MTIFYILLLVLALLISGFGWSKKLYKLNAPFSWFFLYTFSVLIGFRSKYSGVDTKSYFNYFLDIKARVNPYYTFEPGFIYFTQLITKIASVEVYIFILSATQLLCIYLSAKLLDIKNKLITLVAFLCFMPGFDMLTNGLRGGFALLFGLLLLVATVVKHNRLALINVIPAFFHASYAIVTIVSLFVKKFSGQKMNLFIFVSSLIFFGIWLTVNPVTVIGFFESLNKDANSLGRIGRLVRYLIIEKELMSFSVKLYFIALSILFSCIYFITLKRDSRAENDEVLTRMAFIALSIQFIYALFSFSQYSYRFMFLAFPVQILMFSYIMDKYFFGMTRSLIVFAICFFGIITTYTSKTFSSFILLSL